MRLILKPLGIVLILIAFAVLTIAALNANKKTTKAPVVFVNSKTTDNLTIPADAIVNGVPLIPAGSSQWNLIKTTNGDGSVKIVPVTNPPDKFDQALQITVTKADSKQIWAVQVARKIPFVIPGNWKFALRFWARSPQSGTARIVLEESKDPYEKELLKDQPLTPEWKQYVLPVSTKHGYPEMGTQIGLQVGGQVGTYEFSQVELVDVNRRKPAGGK